MVDYPRKYTIDLMKWYMSLGSMHILRHEHLRLFHDYVKLVFEESVLPLGVFNGKLLAENEQKVLRIFWIC